MSIIVRTRTILHFTSLGCSPEQGKDLDRRLAGGPSSLGCKEVYSWVSSATRDESLYNKLQQQAATQQGLDLCRSCEMTTLYEDKFVCITEDGVEIKWYYFPCGTSKFIAFEDIKCFRLEPISLLKSKGWGMGLSNVWYACDLLRQMSNEQRR
mmetsp:Transcript_3479/g.9765  ORF Transcript_3479/g.9765 Transcript_3479/m.9765 type:complete len:153 (+) Transcript_3479:1097-1555(+)